MKALIFISSIGATEGNLLTAFQASGGSAVFYNVEESSFILDDSVRLPAWLSRLPAGHMLRARFFEEYITRRGFTHLVSVGLEAGSYVASNLRLKVTPILSRGDLDFSHRRRRHLERFENMNSNSPFLLLSDPWEMDKAVGHGSRIPHFYMPRYRIEGENVLSEQSRRIIVIHPGDIPAERLNRQVEELRDMAGSHGFEVEEIDVRRLYSRRDLSSGRALPGTMRYRLKGSSHAVLLGDSREYSAIIGILGLQAQRMVVEDTINNSYLYDKAAFTNFARGAAILDKLEGIISGNAQGGDRIAVDLESAQLPRFLREIEDKQVPLYYEELFGFGETANPTSFNVFFSVAPLENRVNGARPQRIRNMSEAFEDLGPCIRLTPHHHFLKRRSDLLRALVDGGAKPAYFYGENSTSPMDSYDTISQVTGLMRFLKISGCRVSWFIRDLHWLSPDHDYLMSSTSENETFVDRGIYELRTICEVADILFAPDTASVKGFSQLLSESIDVRGTWVALPPGTSGANAVKNRASGRDERITLVYSGGVGGFYSMDAFLESLAHASHSNFRLDFIIRAEDKQALLALLEKHGVPSYGDWVRISTSNFEDYRPATKVAYGVILLDSEYAKLSFPYKTMSMLEKGLGVITYDDMAIAEFVKSQKLGVVVERDLESLRRMLSNLHLDSLDYARLEEARERNSWHVRAAQVVRHLENTTVRTVR